jgi:hypothetical protein
VVRQMLPPTGTFNVTTLATIMYGLHEITHSQTNQAGKHTQKNPSPPPKGPVCTENLVRLI